MSILIRIIVKVTVQTRYSENRTDVLIRPAQPDG